MSILVILAGCYLAAGVMCLLDNNKLQCNLKRSDVAAHLSLNFIDISQTSMLNFDTTVLTMMVQNVSMLGL
jgi:hypothetical protein